ncbi:MAG: hypothetical protein BIFFINMI_02405 [Phycisphaerae bacterium]|nr:hypothetical protein [Phycisphaerae bacterium]
MLLCLLTLAYLAAPAGTPLLSPATASHDGPASFAANQDAAPAQALLDGARDGSPPGPWQRLQRSGWIAPAFANVLAPLAAAVAASADRPATSPLPHPPTLLQLHCQIVI